MPALFHLLNQLFHIRREITFKRDFLSFYGVGKTNCLAVQSLPRDIGA